MQGARRKLWLFFAQAATVGVVFSMALAARRIAEQGLAAPVCVGVHGIFSADALDALRQAGVARVVTSNTVAHETNAIDLSALVARSIESIQKESRDAIRIR